MYDTSDGPAENCPATLGTTTNLCVFFVSGGIDANFADVDGPSIANDDVSHPGSSISTSVAVVSPALYSIISMVMFRPMMSWDSATDCRACAGVPRGGKGRVSFARVNTGRRRVESGRAERGG